MDRSAAEGTQLWNPMAERTTEKGGLTDWIRRSKFQAAVRGEKISFLWRAATRPRSP